MLLDEREVFDHVEARHEDLRRAEADRAGHQQVERVDVEIRQHVEKDVVATHRHGGEELLLVRGEVAVRQHHALREAGRAARVRKGREVVERDADARRARGGLGDEVVEPGGPVGGRAGAREQPARRELRADGLDHRPERLVDEHRLRPRVVDLEAHLTLLGERVDRVHDAAGLQRAVEGDDELDRVRHEERDAIARPDPAASERHGEAVRRGVEVGVGHGAVPVDEGRLRRDLAGDLAQAVLQRDLAIGEACLWARGERHPVPPLVRPGAAILTPRASRPRG